MPSLPTRTLFTQLVDDAAVFPPGNFSLSEAIDRRSARRGTPASDFVGPLLLPPRLIDEALEDHSGLVITVVGRRETPLDEVIAAAENVADAAGHALSGLEVAAVDGWEKALDLSVPVAVEVPAGAAGRDLLPGIADHEGQVIAKLRTGSTPANDVPSVPDTAAFITECVQLGIAFKLTGGLHRAIAHTAGDHATGAEEQYGFLGILLAVQAALLGGDVSAALTDRDETSVTDAIRAMSEADAMTVRNVFTSFGCCDVFDPIHDLAALGLIPERNA
ncbi:MAG TPA: hypothetical protein VG502_13110 [Flexivirga sp.]|uniref:hypothetical protein n=1 Tax=Flexivirga sp. TaxID=1962927 RepID=UPI002BB2EFF6|nr:hypothetical protein [Flexivirga sp.]HWC23231.1 hypothetical protein [Flexivirga sp.]